MNAGKARLVWLAQALSGALLVLLLGLHWLAQHYLANGGLRSYAEVVDYLRNPLVFSLETAFLVLVTLHALLGVRAILLDLGPRPALAKALDYILWGVGLASIGYGIQLTLQIIH